MSSKIFVRLPLTHSTLSALHPSTVSPDPTLNHATLSTLYLRTLCICRFNLCVPCTRHKWGACRNRKARRSHRKGNVLPLHNYFNIVLIIILFNKGTWYYPGSAHLLYLCERKINFVLGWGNCGQYDDSNSLVLAIGIGLYNSNGAANCDQVAFIHLHTAILIDFFIVGQYYLQWGHSICVDQG
jgi:hypothetical protein